ncbi:AI-2E family transporter [Corynebacterium diphtheriae]|nr:AI-2E family transporter [Corynebacterium diphtheriae]
MTSRDSNKKDLPSALTEAVESADETPSAHITEATAYGHRDRAVIIGMDARWAAGWALRFIIVAIASIMAWRGLGTVWHGVLPVILAILLSTVLWPPVRWLRSKKVPPALAVVIVILGFFGIIGGIFAAMAPSVSAQSKDLVDRASDGISRLLDWAENSPFDIDTSQIDGYLSNITNTLKEQSSNIANGVFTGLSTASTILVTMILMLILSFFFLKDGTRFLPMVRRLTGPNVGWHLTEVLTRIWNTLAGFIRTQAIVSLVDAVLIGVGLLILKVPLALVLAVLTFFGGFIPIVGAFTAGALAVVIALVSNGMSNALMVLVLIIAVQQIEGHILQPVLQSKAMNLHAAVVLLSVTVGSTLFGVIGAFLAVPVAATLAVLVRYHSELVALRAGEITIDDMVLATGEDSSSDQPWGSVKEQLSKLSLRKPNVIVRKQEDPTDA